MLKTTNFEWKGIDALSISKYKYVHMHIDSAYQLGTGWTASQEAAFKNEVYAKLAQEFFIADAESDFDCDHLHEKNAYGRRHVMDKMDLYMHPMEFTGFATDEQIQKIQELLKDCRTMSITKVDIKDGYYELSDMQYEKLLSQNIVGIKEFLDEIPNDLDPGEIFAKEHKLNRVGDRIGLSSMDVDWRFVNNAKTMLTLLDEYQKEKDGLER